MEKLHEIWIDYHYQIIIGVVIVFVLGIFAWSRDGGQQTAKMAEPITSTSSESSAVQSTNAQPARVCVDVKGAVKKPGVYYFKRGARVAEALQKAGGPAAGAAMKEVNLAKELTDQQVVYVPMIGEKVPTDFAASTQNSGNDDGKATVNLNTASKEQLCQITGIGDKKADLILEYRQQHGQFKSVDELVQINGFGEKTVAKLKDQVAV